MSDETENRPNETESPRDPDQTVVQGQPERAAGAEHAGQVINQYTLVRLLGEGGFGTVWLAEQQEPVRRQVALKIIKLGMDTRQVIARFEAERQALAVMDHPNIAKVFDAGSTETGRPYFVMEYADGVPFTRYCDRFNLSVRARLELFQKVCHAVQHAHQKGIIHRDIKPSNVLVIDVDGEPAPKVIDFGIAKATEARLTEHSMFTEHGQIVGTPAYMSPEQTGLNSADIDTRSDIYSLGALLYETLTGEGPFNDKTLLSAGMDEIRRIIREVDPPRPSTRLSTAGVGLTTAAQHRAIEPQRLCSLLTGDIDLIVMKAIEKDRTRRYQTATSFAEDIERYLRDEPVLASPPSAQYRVGKFVRRNRLAVTAGTLVLAALLFGTVGTSIGLVRATRAEGRAVRAADDAESARELESVQRRLADERAEEARIERDKAEQVAAFLTDMLAGVGAQVAQGADTSLLRAILDKTATRVGEELVGQPEIEAKIRSSLGDTFHQIRDFERAEENFLRARELYQSVHPTDAPEVAQSLGDLGLLRVEQTRAEESADLLREALEMWRRLSPEDPAAIPLAMIRLANTLVRLEQFPEAEELLLGALDRLQVDAGDHHENIGIVYNSLANLMQHLEDYESAEDYYDLALELHRTSLGDDHPFVATSLHNLALLLAVVGRNKEAIDVQEQALARSRTLFPDGHEQTASCLVSLANLYRYDDERSPEAPGMIKEAIALQSRLYGEDSHDVAYSFHELGRILDAQRDYEGAVEAYEHAAAVYTALYGEQNNNVAVSLQAVARTLGSLGRYDEAHAMFERALQIQNALFGDDHEELAITLVNLGSMHRKAGNYVAAEEAILRALAVFDAADLGRTDFAASSYENLGRIYRATDRLEASADALRRGLDIRREANGPNARNTLGASYALAGTLIDIEAFDEAEALLQHALDDPDGVINARIRIKIQERYADLLFASERFDECTNVLEACYRAYLDSGAHEDAGEVLTDLVRAGERRQALDPSPANEAATARWRQLLDEHE